MLEKLGSEFPRRSFLPGLSAAQRTNRQLLVQTKGEKFCTRTGASWELQTGLGCWLATPVHASFS